MAGAGRSGLVGLLGVARPLNIAGPDSVAFSGAASGASSDPGAARRLARRWGLLVAAGWLVQAGLRAWLSRGQVVPLATPDESAYLIAARVLAGGVPANFSYSTLYPAGYPLLITPVFWFTHDPVTAYRAVLLINAPLSALVVPLGYVLCCRLGLSRPEAFGVAMVAGLLPAGLFYSEYAMTDAIYPVIVLGWLLTVHGWLVSSSRRGRYAAAAGSALLAGYADAVHSRGLVILAVYLLVWVWIVWRRPGWRGSAVLALVTLALPLGVASVLNGRLAATMYPSGARSLGGEALIRLRSVHGLVLICEQAAGQMWRFALDGWGVAGIGFVAAAFVLVRRGTAAEVRLMAALGVTVTLAIAVLAPAGLPPDQSQTWASGRYLDGMVVAFFLVGAVVLLRAARRQVLVYAAWVVPPTVVAAAAVVAYAGSSVPTKGFGAAFAFAEPAVLTQDWTQAGVVLATAVAVGLLALWVFFSRWRAVLLVGLGVVSLVAVVQMTADISRADTPAQEANTTGLVTGSGLRPGEQLAVGYGVPWESWMPQAYEIPWAQLSFFSLSSGGPPSDASVVEVAWPAGEAARDSWPGAPAGWRIVASDQAAAWVAWRRSG
jgi:hypothetical protein